MPYLFSLEKLQWILSKLIDAVGCIHRENWSSKLKSSTSRMHYACTMLIFITQITVEVLSDDSIPMGKPKPWD